MSRLSTAFLLTGATAIALSCAPPATETTSAPAEKGAAQETHADPTVVDSAHYTAEFENDLVRVVRIRYGAGEESVMHHHPDSVAVFLTDHHVQFRAPDGSTSEVTASAGEHRYLPAGDHLPMNVSADPWEVILVELKSGGTLAPRPEGAPDSTVVDPDHYVTEFENERVRILRIKYGPGETSVMHYHPENVAVFLNAMKAEFLAPDGSKMVEEMSAGQHAFAPAGLHLPKNVGGAPLEVVLIELLAP